MRILAIIPACEGSVILPNKNMRVLHGKPMIYYVINNAIKSEYITDVLVTSNSKEIISLAKQMNVMTRHRSEELCCSDVSLDRVIWDVFEQLDIRDYEIVITMQSISPLLCVNTLDRAIERFIQEKFDTLISVKNQPQFYWTMESDKPVPMQRRRMNRHRLPPFYMETGAFLITKSCYITLESRLGANVGLFELQGDEAIDVNSFGDLKQVENAMKRQKTAIFVNGNDQIGLGHINRMLQVADELFTKPDIYFDGTKTELEVFGETTYSLIPVSDGNDFIEKMNSRDYDIIINDVLDTEECFMTELRRATANAKIVNFEDNGIGAKYADIVINALYEEESSTNVIYGYKYYIIPKQFLLYDEIIIHDQVKEIVVTFGGADPRNYTQTVLDIVCDSNYRDIHFTIVIGKANKNYKLLSGYDVFRNVTILYDIENMAEVMSHCDLAVSSRGRTCYELASLGIPTISIAQHEREAKHKFVSEENGFICLGPNADRADIKAKLNEMIYSDRETRKMLQAKMLIHDLKSGRKNVADIIQLRT